MPPINVAPTRSNLLRLRQELQFTREGYEILDRKREVLTSELLRIAHDAETLQAQVWEMVAAAYAALEKARLTMGQERVEWAALAVGGHYEVDLKFRGVMGVPLPSVEARGAEAGIPFSLGDTKASLDEAGADFRDLLGKIPELCELTASVWWLAAELRKTLRRVNALEHIFIPSYEATIAFVENALEENEREEIFRLKWLKVRKTRTAEGAPPA
jgi:V/A-type H+-transporting ATPase subunit D